MMKKALSILLAVVLCISIAACTQNNSVPTSPNLTKQVLPLAENLSSFKTHGRAFLTDAGLTCDQSASGIEFNGYMQGAVNVKFIVTTDCYFTVYIDGQRAEKRICILPDPNGYTAEIAYFDTPGDHNIIILKETEALKTLCTIVSVDFVGTIKAPPANNDLLIEVLGDSITCGYGNLCKNGAENPGSPMYQDATCTYAVLAAQALGADVRLVSCSGIGVAKGHVQPTMDQYFSAASYYRDASVAYTPDRIPDLVVINLGTNDGGTNASDASLAVKVPELIELIRTTYGKEVPILWVYGMMGDGRWSSIGDIIYQRYGTTGNIDSLEIPSNFEGGGEHPDKDAHLTGAKILAQYIFEMKLKG